MSFEDSIWDDGEWVNWSDIHDQIQHHEWKAKHPNGDYSLVQIFYELLAVSEDYYLRTNRHLQVYGDLGELFGAITLGIKLHKNYAQGSDGRLGDDFIEVKTIAPFNGNDTVTVDMRGNFSKLLIVKINEDFEVSSRLIDRKELARRGKKKVRIKWADLT
ncbi:MAG: hypothetical protein EP347_03165 [Alphaproteobacteria bacterium]|nr:MAG: hypothetical protein EP347_03165 [Alphaproteobacteria bacterium]